jgi:hypothetical protein
MRKILFAFLFVFLIGSVSAVSYSFDGDPQIVDFKIYATQNETWLDWEVEEIENSSNFKITIYAEKEEYNTTIVYLDENVTEIDRKVETWKVPNDMAFSKRSENSWKKNKNKFSPSVSPSKGRFREWVYFYNPSTDGEIKLFDNSVYIEPIFNTTSILNNLTFENNNNTHISISDVAPYDSLVGYWSFDGDKENTEGFTAYDWTNGDNDGTAVGNAVANETGARYGDALQLDGTGDYVSVLDNDDIRSGDATISIWFNIRTPETSVRYLIGLGTDSTSRYGIGYTANDLFSYDDILNEGDLEFYTSGDVISNDTWYHLAVVFNSSGAKIPYLNGVQKTIDSSGANLSQLPAGTSDLFIGRGISGTSDANSLIDEVMIFNTSLTDLQIQDIYNNQSARFKSKGNQTIKKINITAGDDLLNLSVSGMEIPNGTNVSVSLGEWDIQKGYNTTMDGLVSYWPLDFSPNDLMEVNNGTISADVSNGSGVYNGSYVFDGSADRVTVSYDDSLNFSNSSEMSVSAWAKVVGSSPAVQVIVGQYQTTGNKRNWRIYYSTGAGFTFTTSADGTSGDLKHSTSSSVSVGTWYHVVATWNGTTQKIYLNGIDEDDEEDRPIFAGTDAYFEIGASMEGQNFNGSIDEVMVFNRSLSADEIKDLYVKGRANWSTSVYQNYSDGMEFDLNTSTTDIFFDLSANSGINFSFSPNWFENYTINIYSSDTSPAPSCGFGENATESGCVCNLGRFIDDSGICTYSTSGGYIPPGLDELFPNMTIPTVDPFNMSEFVEVIKNSQEDPQGFWDWLQDHPFAFAVIMVIFIMVVAYIDSKIQRRKK